MVAAINPAMLANIVAHVPLRRPGVVKQISAAVHSIVENDLVTG
jgi:hypothetical protein